MWVYVACGIRSTGERWPWLRINVGLVSVCTLLAQALLVLAGLFWLLGAVHRDERLYNIALVLVALIAIVLALSALFAGFIARSLYSVWAGEFFDSHAGDPVVVVGHENIKQFRIDLWFWALTALARLLLAIGMAVLFYAAAVS